MNVGELRRLATRAKSSKHDGTSRLAAYYLEGIDGLDDSKDYPVQKGEIALFRTFEQRSGKATRSRRKAK